MFPFSIKIKKRITSENDEELIGLIEKHIVKNKGHTTRKENDLISFKTNFFKLNTETFAGIDKGTFLIKDGFLYFEFFVYRLLFFAILTSLAPVFGMHNIYLFIYFFSILYIGNLVFIIIKSRRIINMFCLQD